MSIFNFLQVLSVVYFSLVVGWTPWTPWAEQTVEPIHLYVANTFYSSLTRCTPGHTVHLTSVVCTIVES